MNLKIKISLTIVFILTFFLVCVSQTIVGKIVRVSDGDTIVLLDSTNQQIRIRLHGIDCPENGQDFANVAKKYTSDLCFGKAVTVDVKDIDRCTQQTIFLQSIQENQIINTVWPRI